MFINLNISYSYGSIIRYLLFIRKNYPKILEIEAAGISHDGREIPLVRVGKGKKGPLFIAGVHAREAVNPIVLVAIIEKMVRLYYSAGEELLDNYSLYFMPLINPDGYEIATKGYMAINDEALYASCIKLGIDYADYKLNARGIDINRNFASESYVRSKYSGAKNSENETRALINACNTHDFMGLIDFHSRGNSIYYYREAMSDEYNARQYEIARRLAEVTGYSLNIICEENPDKISGGNTVHYFSETFKLPAITIETVEENAVFPLDKSYQKIVFDEMKEVPLEFLKILIARH